MLVGLGIVAFGPLLVNDVPALGFVKDWIAQPAH